MAQDNQTRLASGIHKCVQQAVKKYFWYMCDGIQWFSSNGICVRLPQVLMFVMPCPTKYSYIPNSKVLISVTRLRMFRHAILCFIRCIFMGLIFHLGQIEICLPSSRLPSVLNWMCPSNKIPQPLIHCKLQLKFSKATRIKLMMDRVQCSFFSWLTLAHVFITLSLWIATATKQQMWPQIYIR